MVTSRRHDNLIVLRGNKVIGGITYRMFQERNFVEIVFCTVSTDEQIHVCDFASFHRRGSERA